jgi:hypothetical protein
MNLVQSLLRWLSGALFSLCGGAMWAVLLLIAPRQAPWFALVAALIAVLALRVAVVRGAWAGAASAGAYFLLAAGYTAFLRAGILVARSVGFGLGKVLTGMGWEMACAVNRAHSSRTELLALGLGFGLALLLGARSARRAGGAGAAN